MTAPILLCGFNDQSDQSISIVINEADGSILYQNGPPPKLSGGSCDFTNPYNCYSYIPAAAASAFSITDAAKTMTVEATITMLSNDSCFVIGKSGDSGGAYTYANWAVGIYQGKIFVVTGSTGAGGGGANGSLFCNISSSTIALGTHHIAWVIDGLSVTVYLDGVAVLQGANSSQPRDDYPRAFYIGTQPNLPGYNPRGVIVDEIRITRDVVYSGPFTPPAPGSLSSYVYPEITVQTEIDGTFAPIRVFVGNGMDIPARSDYGYIEGTVKNSGVPVPDQRVACFDNSHNLINEVKSGSDGSYRFDNLPRLNGDTYVVMARDSNGLLSPATADNRIPEAYS